MNDVTEVGYSLLHVRARLCFGSCTDAETRGMQHLMAAASVVVDISDLCEKIQYLIERGARTDWECEGWCVIAVVGMTTSLSDHSPHSAAPRRSSACATTN